ncbi:GNAT family N-acetyltransferase [Aggregatilinea lenta]|uniref:GNAT family N-acetyltransferase n=1 Tax=Aggregatilinea lenta TaxID=913108 RepID=UPI000E5B934A|nr:GNAT family N-acetyltransferase [Aggregatilinea lenta]
MPAHIVPFTPEMIPGAAALLARRHQRDRAALPLLPQHPGNSAAQHAIQAALARPHVSGVAAIDGDRLLGYLIGDMVIDSLWGRAAWVRPAGCALAEGQSTDLIAPLYAELGARWVSRGCFAHFAVMPTADRVLLDAWFLLGFGVEQIHALLPLDEIPQPARPPAGISIRHATPADRAIMADFSGGIGQQQVLAPTWGLTLPEQAPDLREGWGELVEDDTVDVWFAFEGDQPVGTVTFFPSEVPQDFMFVPPQTTHLTCVVVREAARQRGVLRALLSCGLAHARAQGFQFCETDWRSANLPIARALPRTGFRPALYRLVRRIDPRIAWANGSTPD